MATRHLIDPRLGTRGRALELADRAREHGREQWVPFVSATSAAACAVAGDRVRAEEAAAETIQQLQRLSHASLTESVHAVARIWTGVVGLDGFELLLSMVGGIADEWTRGGAIGQLAKGAGAALTPTQLNLLIDGAVAIEDEWIRLSAMQSLAETAAARGDRTALASLLQKTSAFENDWAAGDLVVALAAAAAPLGDEDLLNQVLTWTSGQRAMSWNAVAVVGEAARVMIGRGDRQRGEPLIRRALEAGANDLRSEERERDVHDAYTISCLSLLGRHGEAAVVLDRVIDAVLKTPGGYSDTILEDLEPSALSKVADAFVSKSPRVAAAAAVALARLGRAAEAASLVDRVKANDTAANAADRTSTLFLCAQTLAALNRTDDGVRCALDALDVGRTLDSSYHGAIVGLLAEALADLRRDDAVKALHDALVTTGA